MANPSENTHGSMHIVAISPSHIATHLSFSAEACRALWQAQTADVLSLPGGSTERACRSLLQKLDADSPMSVLPRLAHANHCKAHDLGDVLYKRRRLLNAAILYEHALSGAHKSSDTAAIYKRLTSCYELLNLTESAEHYARRALGSSGGSITPMLDLARHLEKAGNLDKAEGYFRAACSAYSATHSLPKDIRLNCKPPTGACFGPGRSREVISTSCKHSTML